MDCGIGMGCVSNGNGTNPSSYSNNGSENNNSHHPTLNNNEEFSFISHTDENGLCLNAMGTLNCSGGEEYKEWWITNWSPILREKLSTFAKTGDLTSFGIDAHDYWSGKRTSAKLGLGLDVVTQLLKDAPRTDLTWNQRLARAGVSGFEGVTISQISATVAMASSEAVFTPSLSLAVETGQAWILPVAVISTWVTTYVAVNVSLNYVADEMNSTLAPGLGY